jgi:hypothetical protein
MRRSTRGGPPDADQGSRLGQSPIHEDARPFFRDKTPVSALRRAAVCKAMKLPCSKLLEVLVFVEKRSRSYLTGLHTIQGKFLGFITPKKDTSLTNRPARHESPACRIAKSE